MLLVKRFIKNNFLLILSFLILFSFLIKSTYNYKEELKSMERSVEKLKKKCNEKELIDENEKEVCKSINEKKDEEKSFFLAFNEIEYFAFNDVSFILFLFIVCPSLFFTSRYMKHRMIVNEATRCNYKTSLFKYFKKAYKPIFIIPVLIIMSFIIAYLFTGNFKVGTEYINSIPWSTNLINKPFIFMALFILNSLILSILYINISLIIVRKNHNFFVALILSFLLFYGYDIFLEIFVGGIIFTSILHSDFGVVSNILNIATFNDVLGTIAPFIIPTISLIISFIILFFMYKDKEKLIIDCEK